MINSVEKRSLETTDCCHLNTKIAFTFDEMMCLTKSFLCVWHMIEVAGIVIQKAKKQKNLQPGTHYMCYMSS